MVSWEIGYAVGVSTVTPCKHIQNDLQGIETTRYDYTCTYLNYDQQ